MSAGADTERHGKIVTFYSYKGGTGRSMALANVAWLLASSGKRVLAIDWDLEAPGLHRYFEPFLTDKSLEKSAGIIDFVRDFATAAVAPGESKDGEWYDAYCDLLVHALPLQHAFPEPGFLHLVPAGRQDTAYALRVNSFDWQDFYARLGGGVLFERVKRRLRALYDFVLIDSRTGVSDTSGLCTIQMPDELVVCFTLNRQSIYGASATARSAFKQRLHTETGVPTLKLWPVPTRVEASEKDRLEIAATMARARFSGLMPQLLPVLEDKYWGEISVPYEPYYAYEEVLAAFRDRPRQTTSMLSRMEAIATYIADGAIESPAPMDEITKSEGLARFTSHSSTDYEQEFRWLAEEYESIRQRIGGGRQRTELMGQLVDRVQLLGGAGDAGAMAEKMFAEATDGGRVIGLALARVDRRRQHIELALEGIEHTRSPFEQYQALLLADALSGDLHPTAVARLINAIESQLGRTIPQSDPSRWVVSQRMIKKLAATADHDVYSEANSSTHEITDHKIEVVHVACPSSYVRYNDVKEQHGPWVKTRGSHALKLPRSLRIGRYPVTNSTYLSFVKSGGYQESSLWGSVSKATRRSFVSLDGSPGPANWPSCETIPPGKDAHPVTSVSFIEAQAFVAWCNSYGTGDRGWMWGLPPEDHWEFAARSEQGLIYPWGDAFDITRCNTSESQRNDTTEVTQFEAGASKAGCCDMAGNVWEFVIPTEDSRTCILRGGSFKNDRYVLRSYLRLLGVNKAFRADDFGIRLAQIEVGDN